MNDKRHANILESEIAEESGLINYISRKDLLLDIKAIISEYYIATFTMEENTLQISFSNGQKFFIKAYHK